MRENILRRIGRSGLTGHLRAFETVGLASAATLCSAFWVGVAVPTLSVLPASDAEGSRNVSIALESALLGIDDGTSRKSGTGSLAARLGLFSSSGLLPSADRLRAAAGELAAFAPNGSSSASHVVNGNRALTVTLSEQLLAADQSASDTAAPASSPAPSPPPDRAPAPVFVSAPAPAPRVDAPDGGKAPAGAGAPPASSSGKDGVKPGAAKHAGNDAPVAGPAVPAYGLDPADESGDASVGGQGVAVDPGAANDPNGTASGQAGGAANGQANGAANGAANGQGNGQANGQGNGQANGQANGQGNGAANGNAGGNGQSHGAGNGH